VGRWRNLTLSGVGRPCRGKLRKLGRRKLRELGIHQESMRGSRKVHGGTNSLVEMK